MQRTCARITEERGFTLVEVLVVALIIPILAGIAIPAFIGQKDKSTDAQAKSAVRNAATAIETFHSDLGTYAGATKAALEKVEPSLKEVAAANLTITPNGTAGYTLAVKQAKTTNVFTITKVNGIATRSCTVKGKGGCPPSGTW